MAEPLNFLTFEDIVRAGTCAKGVLERCREENIFFGTVDEVLDKFPDERDRILRAANLDGYGYGYGYG